MNLSARIGRAEASIGMKRDAGRVYGVAATHGDREAAIHFARGQGWVKDDWLMVHSVDAAGEKLPCLVYVMGIGEMVDGATRSGGRPIFDAAEHQSDPFNPEFVRWSDPDKNRLQTG